MSLPDIHDCPGSILTCQFDYKPDYASIIMLSAIVINLFCIFPCSVSLLNQLLFEKLIGFPLVSICCSKKGSNLNKNVKNIVNITNTKTLVSKFNYQNKLNKPTNFQKIEPENIGNLDDNVSLALDSDRDNRFGV